MESVAKVGEASASLGLISTLVFGICVGALVEQDDSSVLMDLFLATATSFSTVTIAFSLLEHYYIQTLLGAWADDGELAETLSPRKEISSPRTLVPSAPPEGPSSPDVSSREAATPERCAKPLLPAAQTLARSSRSASRIFGEADPVSVVSSFSRMRMGARNAMWLSLLLLLGSLLTKIDPLMGSEPHLDSSAKGTAFYAGCGCCLAVSWLLGFRTADIVAYIALSTALGLLCHFMSEVLGPRFHGAKVSAGISLVLTIVAVPAIVKTFRNTYQPLIKLHRISV